MRAVTESERRARLARRHHLTPEASAADVVELARRLVGLHASDPSTVFLAARARIPGFSVADLETAMYQHGQLRKHLAMRRTLFVFPTDLLPVVQAACTKRVLAAERKRLIRDVERAGITADGARWLTRAERAALRELTSRGQSTGAQLSKTVPELQARIRVGEGRKWGGEIGVAGRVLTILEAGGRIVRGQPDGSWTSSRHRWLIAPDGPIPALPEDEALTELVRCWLAAFGPATIADLAWWTGLGVTRVRAAVAALAAVEVSLDGERGVLLPEDVEPEPPAAPAAAFLPSLDPTTMGWKGRSWYLGEHGPALFDTSGNAGPTVWWDGRVVGGWTQRPTGEVAYKLLEDVGAEARDAIQREAAVLEDWLAGTVVTTRFGTPLDRALRG
jgi:hypothetical protein